MAREASSNGDKILSENYFQHADHFTRILNEQESFKREKFADNKEAKENSSVETKVDTDQIINDKPNENKNDLKENTVIQKNQPEVS